MIRLLQLLVHFFATLNPQQYTLYTTVKGVPVYRVTNAAWSDRLSRDHIAAFALGKRIFINGHTQVTPSLLAHELKHVQQYQEDVLFPIKYAAYHLKYGYQNNPYEKAARASEHA